jgi:hypothetical protein
MSLALLDDDLDFATKFLVALFNLERRVLEPRVEATANVAKRHVGFGQGGEIIERLRFRQGTGHARILRPRRPRCRAKARKQAAWRTGVLARQVRA